MSKLAATIVLLLWSLTATAQGSGLVAPDSIRVYAVVVDSGRVLLRWAPPNTAAYYAADTLGYTVERRSAWDADWVPIAGSPLRRYPDTTLRRLADASEATAMFYMATRPEELPIAARDFVGFVMAGTVVDQRAARASGMLTEDAPAPGVSLYRVSLGDGRTGPGYAIVDTRRAPRAIPQVTELTATWSDRAVTLVWDWPEDALTAFAHVYRVGAGDSLTQVSSAPVFLQPDDPRASFTDSLTDNDTDYGYVVRVGDQFGRVGAPSPVARGRGVPAVAFTPPSIAPPEELPGRHVQLAWTYADDAAAGAHVVEQRVFRALQHDGPWQALPVRLGGEARALVDSSAVAEQQYYRVEAYDTYGRMRRSGSAYFLALDTVPPPPPVGLQAIAYPSGEVAVGWEPVEDPGLLGYRVFFSNSRARPGQRLSPKHETVNLFRDTLSLASLGDSVYYRVVSLDLRDNVSDFSAPVAVALPDVRAPEPARLLTTTGDTAGIRVEYVPSVALDVAREQWRRRAAGTTDWQVFATRAVVPLPRDSNGVVPAGFAEAHLMDSTAGDTYGYEYQLAVFDEAGLRSLSNVVPGRRQRAPYVQGVEGLSAKPTDDARAVTLQWRYGGPPIIKYLLYRAAGDGPLLSYREFAPEALDRKGPNRRDGSFLYRWRDDAAAYGRAYRYELVAVAPDGRESRGAQTELSW